MHSRYAVSASAIRIATATPSRALAALAARPQTRPASAGESGAVVDDARVPLAEPRAGAPEPPSTDWPPQPARSKQLRANAAQLLMRPRSGVFSGTPRPSHESPRSCKSAGWTPQRRLFARAGGKQNAPKVESQPVSHPDLSAPPDLRPI